MYNPCYDSSLVELVVLTAGREVLDSLRLEPATNICLCKKSTYINIKSNNSF